MTWTHLPPLLLWPYLFAVGACVGSFLGVVVARMPQGLSLVRPRSRCDSCHVPIAWYDNLPLISYVCLRGRCRACHASVGVRSPLLELLTGLLFVALAAHLGPSWQLGWWLVFASGLLAITFLDIDHFWVPDAITYPLGAWALLACLMPGGPALSAALMGLLPAALLWGTAVAFERIAGKEGLGLGDIKLLAAMGLMLGLSSTLTLLFLASLQGAVLGSIILAAGGHRQAAVPEGPEGEGPAVASHGLDPSEHGTGLEQPDFQTRAADVEADTDADAWQPDPKAVPFGPFLVLAAFEVLFFPNLFSRIFGRLVAVW